MVGCKLIFNEKEGIQEIKESKYKIRLVAKGFTNAYGFDYNKIFSLMVKYYSIRVLMAIIINGCQDQFLTCRS